MTPQSAPHSHGPAEAILLHQARGPRDSDDPETRRPALSEAGTVHDLGNRRFVRDAGGAISIHSEPGLGTAVILRLPASAVRPKFIREESER